VQHGQGERPLQPLQRLADRVREPEPLGQPGLDQVGDALGVGLGGEPVPLALQLLPEGVEVLDDPVVDHRHPSGAVEVGMGVPVGRLPVGRPPGVPDPAQPVERGVGAEGLLEHLLVPGVPDDPTHAKAPLGRAGWSPTPTTSVERVQGTAPPAHPVGLG
jgi:hypothetical protein